jgi:hypothetical protein
MIRSAIFTIAILIICLNGTFARSQTRKLDSSLIEVQKWFNAWELVYKDIYKIKTISQVDLVLFDETYVYTTSKVTGKGGISIVGPSLLGKRFAWFKKPHNGKLMLPNGKEDEIRVMSFASPGEKSPFFVMPLTSYWRKQKIPDHGSNLETLTTCVFLHEFAHSQQMKSLQKIGLVMDAYGQLHPDDQLSDDIMQDYYGKDSMYLSTYKLETELFKRAAMSDDETERTELAKQALNMLKDRQAQGLERDKRDLAAMDDFFLTLEGIGQYTAFVWLINPKGGNLPMVDALREIKTRWWSQEQGFDIILLLSKYMKPEQFSKYMFGVESMTSIELLETYITK